MDIRSSVIRDRRAAASDEAISVAGAQIFGRGSHARGRGAAGVTGDRPVQQITTIRAASDGGRDDSGCFDPIGRLGGRQPSPR